MKGAWNQFNRIVVIGLYDSYMRAKALRRNLSSEALKGFRVESTSNSARNRSFSLNSPEISGIANNASIASNRSSKTSQGSHGPHKVDSCVGAEDSNPSPMSKLQMGHAHSMLLKLVSESDSKSVAFTEEPAGSSIDQLHGIRACKLSDVLQTNWHIELHNSQVVLKGCETPGYVIVSAARARIMSYTHIPIWRQGQLRSKSTWNGDIDCMQYYATVDPNNSYERDNIPWLSRENVEDRANTDLSGMPEMIGSGQSVGSVVSSAVSGVASSASASSDLQGPGETVQLQRIIYRCSCKFFYANYGDVDPNTLSEVPLPVEDADVMSVEEGVDTFTLLHESVYAYSNPLQFSVIMDIVNNLLLYVEPKKKAASDRLQSMRFKLQLNRDEDQKKPILQLQEMVREKVQELRSLEKEYYICKTRHEDDIMLQLELEMDELKNWIGLKNEELGMRISCYNESQLQVKAQRKLEKAQQSRVERRNEVCFKYAKWRMTERDGHCGIAELELRNFVYTKVNRDDDTWTHQLELNWVKVENLLAENFYQKVLVPKDPQGQDGENRQTALRITCTEKAPVGGIPVKEHFEVNVAPIQIQMTYQFYKAVMEFFFPDKNVDLDDDDEMDVKGAKKEKKSTKREKKRERGDDSERSSLRSVASFSSADDINKMRKGTPMDVDSKSEFSYNQPNVTPPGHPGRFCSLEIILSAPVLDNPPLRPQVIAFLKPESKICI
ncbi:protein kiaa0100-like [Plakobranchus ocellatus]|uniref:Protein kiaa0100-like n=1 Tax=Plakobranchus ocellatus TaxID=259542 RepID=A0AAV4B602_9GAST|nr:protein kiaa0100-like [Plakobranchus ocellatus]